MDETRLNLTRRFRTATEAREEAETNLSAGSLWVPHESGERPALLRGVVVSLVLPDGGVLEGLRGRISCIAPEGCAVVLDDLPDALVLTRLLGGEIPPPPSASVELAPEDAPPLPPGLVDGSWQPIVVPPPMAAAAPPIEEPPPAPPESVPDPALPLFPAVREVAVSAPAEPVVPAFEASIPEPTFEPQEPAAVFEPRPPAHGFEPQEPAPAFEPQAPEPAVPVSFDSPSRPPDVPADADPSLPADYDGADFPAPRETPVPAVPSQEGMWGDDDSLPAERDSLEVRVEPAEASAPPRPSYTLQYATAAALEVEWLGELGAGRVLVPVEGEPPPLDSRVDVTMKLPDIGLLMLEGTVVHRATGGAGIRLDMDGTTRALIESVLPPKAPATPELPPLEPPTPEPPPIAPPTETPPKRPTPELRKDASGNAEVVVAFDSLADFQREYESNIRRGGVMVPTAERPPVRSAVQVVFSLLGGKREVRVKGEVVLHGPAGIGVQLGEIPQSTRVELESLLAAAAPRTPAAVAAPESTVEQPPQSAVSPSAAPPAPDAGVESAPSAAAPPASSTPSGDRLEGELVEVMREAEVEGEAGAASTLGSKASWLKVLAHLQATRATGLLQASRKAETKSFAVFQGRILDARGEPARDDESMLRVIRKHGLAKPGVLRMLERALDKMPDELVALQTAGVWTPAEIDRARRWQILERSAEIFAWAKGRFKFDPLGDRSWTRPTSGLPIGHVILHGVRSYVHASGEDLARILRPGFDRALLIVPNTGFEPVRVGMQDKELKLWAEIDGKKTLRQLLATSPISQSQSHRLIFVLCRLGVLEMAKVSGMRAVPKDSERAEALKARAADLTTRDVFGRLGISWMCAAPHVQGAWDALRRELAPDLAMTGPVANAAKQVLAIAEDAWRQLMDDRTRRLQRLKLIEDPSRIEAAADMLADRADSLRMQGDAPGAESALQMALDMAPGNPAFVQLLARVRAV